LSQCIRATLQEIDRITVAQDFDRIALTQFTYPFFDVCEAGLPILGAGANSVLYDGPVFFLIRVSFSAALTTSIRMSVKLFQSAALGVAALAAV